MYNEPFVLQALFVPLGFPVFTGVLYNGATGFYPFGRSFSIFTKSLIVSKNRGVARILRADRSKISEMEWIDT